MITTLSSLIDPPTLDTLILASKNVHTFKIFREISYFYFRDFGFFP